MLPNDMHEVETDSSVIWPSWCYNTGENRLDSECLKRASSIKSSSSNNKMKKKCRPISLPEKRMNGGGSTVSPTLSAFANVCTPSSNSSTAFVTSAALKMEVMTERLSPASATTDNNSSGSGSNTPSSLHSETPHGANSQHDRIPSPSLSPAAQLPRSKITEQPMARNYSDIMRNLAAKYNNTNPNNVYKNGLAFTDQRFSLNANAVSPFTNVVASGSSSPPSSCHQTKASANAKEMNDSDHKHMLEMNEAQNTLFTGFGLNSFSSKLPFFPSLVDMGSTQALLNMVRNANIGNITQLENYIKNATSANRGVLTGAGVVAAPTKTTTEMVNNPLDLSSNASMPANKKPKRPANGESFGNSMTAAAADWRRDRVPASKRPGSPKSNTRSGWTKNSVQMLDHQSAAVATVANCLSPCTSSADHTCCLPNREERDVENVSNWSIDDVHNFVSSIDVCSEYADNFREQCIDGVSLSLLTEQHLKTAMNMKLGPALKFKALLAQKIGHCSVCMHCLHCHDTNGKSEDSVSGTIGRSITSVPTSNLSSNPAVVRRNSTD